MWYEDAILIILTALAALLTALAIGIGLFRDLRIRGHKGRRQAFSEGARFARNGENFGAVPSP